MGDMKARNFQYVRDGRISPSEICDRRVLILGGGHFAHPKNGDGRYRRGSDTLAKLPSRYATNDDGAKQASSRIGKK